MAEALTHDRRPSANAWLQVVRAAASAVLVLLPALAVYLAVPATGGPLVTPPPVLAVLNGPGEVLREGESAWTLLPGPFSLHAGDAVRVQETLPLRLPEGSTVQLSAGASVQVVAYAESERRLRLRLLAGNMQVQTSNPLLEIETPATVAALRAASFRVTVQGDEATVSVELGSVEGRTGDSQIPIGEGEQVRIVAGQAQAVRWQRGPAPTPVPGITPQPTPTPMPTAPPPQRTHVVEQGDTLLYIAAKYKTTVEAIVRANSLDDPHSIGIGRKLIIPYTSVP